jgi:hypothetical protein
MIDGSGTRGDRCRWSKMVVEDGGRQLVRGCLFLKGKLFIFINEFKIMDYLRLLYWIQNKKLNDKGKSSGFALFLC